MKTLLYRLRRLLQGRRRDDEIREELAFHLEEDEADRVETGASADAAKRAARLDLGNATLHAEDTRAVWISRVVERIAQDLRYALRRMRRSPVFSIVAIASLAIGIGANTVVFSLFNEVLLRPLSVPDPAALVNLSVPGPHFGSVSCNQAGSCDSVFSYPMFRDLERQQTVLTGLAGYWLFGANLAYGGQTLSGRGAMVSSSYFSVLQLAPTLGRLIGPDDDRAPDGTAVVVLSYAYWVDRFGAAPDVIGKTMTVNGQTMTIVGVGPRNFSGTTVGSVAQVFAPITMRSRLEPPFDSFNDRRWYWVYAFGRLKPGVSIEQARAALDGQHHAILTGVELPLMTKASDDERAQFVARTLVVDPGAEGQSILHRLAKPIVTMLFVVTGIVLVIACANLANLLLARSAARATELAVRASIGASRRRLVGQLLVEACALSLLGGVAGLVLGEWLLAAVRTALAPVGMPNFDVHLDWRVLTFSIGVALLTGVVFGVFPALHSTRTNLASAIKHQAAQSSGARSAARFRAAMILAQMTLSTILLVSAGLFTKSLANVSRVELGIQIDHLVTFTIWPRSNGYTPAAARDLFQRVEERLAVTPGVERAAATSVALVAGTTLGTDVLVETPTQRDGAASNSAYAAVGPGYFETVGIPLVAGRGFTAADRVGAPRVAIVNEAFAKKLGLGPDIVGRRMRQGSNGPLDMEIVGLVRNAKYSNVKDAVPAIFYTPYRQDEHLAGASFYVRTPLDPASFLKTVPAVMATLDPNLPIEDLRTMEDQVRVNEFGDRALVMLSLSFALIATLLAAIGLYGVLAYSVAQRTREFGVRIALGAAPSQVRRLVLRSVVWLTVIGGVIGAGAAFALGRAIESLLYEMKSRDPWVFVTAVGVLVCFALLAGFVPAWRASRIAPMAALKAE
jgi:predicted permease